MGEIIANEEDKIWAAERKTNGSVADSLNIKSNGFANPQLLNPFAK